MRKVASLLALLAFSVSAIAEDVVPKIVLDKIMFQISAKQWVTTQTALLSVSINATLSNADLVKARADIMDRLAKIAKGDWHLLEFSRSQDSSGLEKLYVQAQARVDQSALTSIYQNAKSVSLPGAKYEISGVEFKPSLEETQAIKEKVRSQLYQNINDEVGRINKVYTNQNYTVSAIAIVEGEPVIAAKRYEAKELNTMAMVASPAPLNVSNELMLTALVEVASNRK
ncbi:MAG: hypothetical protein WC627_09565 [Legionella sp.]|jgi:hypothetical protein